MDEAFITELGKVVYLAADVFIQYMQMPHNKAQV